jgi:hypothetical protein
MSRMSESLTALRTSAVPFTASSFMRMTRRLVFLTVLGMF